MLLLISLDPLKLAKEWEKNIPKNNGIEEVNNISGWIQIRFFFLAQSDRTWRRPGIVIYFFHVFCDTTQFHFSALFFSCKKNKIIITLIVQTSSPHVICCSYSLRWTTSKRLNFKLCGVKCFYMVESFEIWVEVSWTWSLLIFPSVSAKFLLLRRLLVCRTVVRSFVRCLSNHSPLHALIHCEPSIIFFSLTLSHHASCQCQLTKHNKFELTSVPLSRQIRTKECGMARLGEMANQTRSALSVEWNHRGIRVILITRNLLEQEDE